jgi:hypothetical protein
MLGRDLNSKPEKPGSHCTAIVPIAVQWTDLSAGKAAAGGGELLIEGSFAQTWSAFIVRSY